MKTDKNLSQPQGTNGARNGKNRADRKTLFCFLISWTDNWIFKAKNKNYVAEFTIVMNLNLLQERRNGKILFTLYSNIKLFEDRLQCNAYCKL